MSELSREEALYACMFKIMLWWRAKDVNGNEWDEAIAEGKRFSANLPPEIRTALAGGGGKVGRGNDGTPCNTATFSSGWGGEDPMSVEESERLYAEAGTTAVPFSEAEIERMVQKAKTPWSATGEPWDAYLDRQREKFRYIESRLASAEKRAEEAERSRDDWKARMETLDAQGYAVARERDALAAKLREAETNATDAQALRCKLSFRDGEVLDLKAKLAAAEKRAEEAEASAQAHIGHYERTVGERNDAVRTISALKAELAHLREVRFTTICSFCDQTVCSLGIEDDQRGAVQSHIETCPKHPMRNLEYRLGEAARERDAALARVKELEAEQERIKSVWMNTDLTTLLSAISKVRDAAGAQP